MWTTDDTWSPGISGGPSAADSLNITELTGNLTVQLDGLTATTYTVENFTFDSAFNLLINPHNPSPSGSNAQKTLAVTNTLTKKGAGTLTVRTTPRVNGLAASFDVNLGSLDVQAGLLSFGTSSNNLTSLTVLTGTTVASGAAIFANSPTAAFGEMVLNGQLNTTGGGQHNTRTFSGLSGAGVIESILNNGRTDTMEFAPDASTSHVFSGTISEVGTSGNVRLLHSGAGRQVFTGVLTYSGTTTISGGGVLEFSGDSVIGANNISITNGMLGLGQGDLARTIGSTAGAGQISLNPNSGVGAGFAAYGSDRTVTFDGGTEVAWRSSHFLSSADSFLILGDETSTHTVTVTNDFTGNYAKTLLVNNGSAEVDGKLSGVISGTSPLVKNGTGALQLTAANLYSGGTSINAGTLLADNVSGSATGSGVVNLAAGATLGGGGFVDGLVTTGDATSVIRAGGVTEVLTLSGGLNAAAGTLFDVRLGTESTRVDIGTFTGSDAADGLLWAITNDGDMATGVTYTLLHFDSVFGLDYTDLALTENSISAGFALDTGFGTDGWLINDHTLQVQFSSIASTAIPEPATYAVVISALAGMFVIGSRRRRLVAQQG